MSWTSHAKADSVWEQLAGGSTIDPAVSNWLLSAVQRNQGQSGDGFRYWTLDRGGEVAGVATFSAGPRRVDVSNVCPGDAAQLADAVRASVPALVGVLGPAASAAGFAGRWTELANVGARPTDGGRVCEVRDLIVSSSVDGASRPATLGDLELLTTWNAGFCADTEVPPPPDPPSHLKAQIETNSAWLWESAGRRLSMALLTAPALGVRRIAHVYTPPEGRGCVSAGALVAHLARLTLDAGERCMLHTQLSNPSSNRLYRALGFEAISESLFYEFAD